MTRVLLTGIGAGAVAALLFASVTSGVTLSIVLFYLAPLPIMIVALGWNHWSGLAAAVAASAMLGGLFGLFFFAMFLASVGAPAWWLGYLALLGRPIANGGAPHMEWYPPGRLVLWAAVIGAAVTAGALATLGDDEDSIRKSLRGALEQILRPPQGTTSPVSAVRRGEVRDPGHVLKIGNVPGAAAPADAPQQAPEQAPTPSPPASGSDDTELVIDMLVRLLPPAAAVIAALTQAVNLWLAAVVVNLSGRLRRPWPDLATLSFPPLAAGAYGALLGGALMPGLPGLVASLFAATLTMAFAMVGFAVMHALTRGMRARAAVLWGAYGCVLLLIWPIAVMTIVGLAETLFGLRGRIFKRGPPAAHDT